MKTTFVYHKFPHHAKHSGYDLLAKYLENYPFTANRVVERLRDIDVSHFSRLPYFSRHHTNRYYFPLEFGLGVAYSNANEKPFLSNDDSHVIKAVYDALEDHEYATRESVKAESEKHVLHFLYGHLSFRYLKSFTLSDNFKVVLTIHEPPELIRCWKFKHLFNYADAIVAVSNSQKAYLRQLYGRKKVYIVPHGIDTKYYYPLKVKYENKAFTTVSVGHYMRDVQTLVNVIRLLRKRGLACKHRIVTFKRFFSAYENLDNVELYTAISDEKLRTLYQTSDCLLLPLENATANNTVLEAMACGLAIISTSCGGLGEYTTRRCSFLEKQGDTESIIRRVIQLKNSPRLMDKMGFESRKKAESFSWEKVSKEIQVLYKRI